LLFGDLECTAGSASAALQDSGSPVAVDSANDALSMTTYHGLRTPPVLPSAMATTTALPDPLVLPSRMANRSAANHGRPSGPALFPVSTPSSLPHKGVSSQSMIVPSTAPPHGMLLQLPQSRKSDRNLDCPLFCLNKLVAPPSTEPGIRAFALFTDLLLTSLGHPHPQLREASAVARSLATVTVHMGACLKLHVPVLTLSP